MSFLFAILSFFVALICLLLILEFINRIKYRYYKARVLNRMRVSLPKYNDFRLLNPYAIPGDYYKAQLHLHTSNSFDVRRKIPVEECIRRYREAGYQFLVITDHDQTTYYPSFNNERFLVIAGQEKTIPVLPFIGRHVLKIDHPAGNIIIPAHPNWGGNFGTGRWTLKRLLELNDFFLIEIYNRHSDSTTDLHLWHKLLQVRGYQQPVWGIAVDDSDNAYPLDQGWIMLKTPTLSFDGFIQALKRGAFYATTGPEATFSAGEQKITVQTPTPATITFIDGYNQPQKTVHGRTGEYTPEGWEGFIRAEVATPVGKAWSQPFFLVPA